MTMSLQALGTVLLSSQPREDANFYIEHFGFGAVAQLDWYVSLQHPDLGGFFLDLLATEHPAAPEALRGQVTGGLLLGLTVADAAAEATRLEQVGLTLIKPLTDEPWGQRRFQVQGPGGVVIEVLQRIPPDETWMQAQLA